MIDEKDPDNEVPEDVSDPVVGGDIEPDDLVDGDDDLIPEDLIEVEDELEIDPDALVVDTPIIDEGSTIAPVDPTKPKAGDDEEDDEDLRTEDDVEADLSSILQEKLASPQETAPEEEEVIGDDRTDGTERLQPRRIDETQCTLCFLLVRQSAPGCPVEDDACPLFANQSD